MGGECQWHEPTLRRRDTSLRAPLRHLPLLILNLLHFRLSHFSQPQERFSLRKKLDKSHNGYPVPQLTADELSRRVKEAFSFKPADIIEALGLKNPIFSATTNYGHFGKADLPWEKLDQKKLKRLTSPSD